MQKKCDFCGETIPVTARRCAYCGSILEVVTNNDYRLQEQHMAQSQNTGEQQAGVGQDLSQSQNTGEQQAAVEQDLSQSQNTGEQQPVVEQQDAGEQNYRAGSQGSAEPQSPRSEDGNQKAPPLQDYRPSAQNYNQPQYNNRGTEYNAGGTQYNAQRPYYKGSFTDDFGSGREPLSNGLKVFLTILFTVLPGIGQLAGIITAIVFMNAADKDRKSFGVALLVACLVLFVLVCIGCFVIGLVSQSADQIW